MYLNGVKLLVGTDFTATNGTSITLASGASVNDVVDIVAYGTFVLADHYTRTASDARYVQPTHTGNLDITGTVTSDGLTVDGSSGYVRIQDKNASVVSGTDMGGIEWRTADSTVVGANRITATINVEGDGTFNASDKAPSRLVFSTHDISGVSPVERMRISSGGDISF